MYPPSSWKGVCIINVSVVVFEETFIYICLMSPLSVISSISANVLLSISSSLYSLGDPERRESPALGCDSSGSPVPFDLSSLGSSLPVRKTPESFLGPNAALVDLDSLVSSKPKPKQPPPPSISASSTNNPFLQNTGQSKLPPPLFH